MPAKRWLQVLLLLNLVAITSASADEPDSSLRAEILRQDAAMFHASGNSAHDGSLADTRIRRDTNRLA
jgi:hypothetical protein